MFILRYILATLFIFPFQLLRADCSGYNLGTLPILYINTENSEEIASKEYYLKANYWIEDVINGGSLGSREEPLSMTIKGRGNATWEVSEKKPYRIKLSNKQSLLGMKKNKHFVLLTGIDDNWKGFLKYPVAFELSRRIDLGWTPEIRQIELILNDDYRGLYFLIEKIRVDKDRINIVEQDDGEEDEDIINGGWLLEFDNYEQKNQVKLVEGKREKTKPLWVTHHSPDSLSDKQRDYLIKLLERCNDCIYTDDKTNNEWENYIDIESLAKFYIIQEILCHRESFMGSTYLYKDRGDDEKLKFGPLWDMGVWIYMGGTNKFIYENPPYEDQHWIAEIAKFPHFQEVIRNIWSTFKKQLDLEDFEMDVISKLQTAAENNFKRWPNDRWTGSLMDGKTDFDENKNNKIAFLNSVWSNPTGIIPKSNETTLETNQNNHKYSLTGSLLLNENKSGVYIMNGKKFVNNVK